MSQKELKDLGRLEVELKALVKASQDLSDPKLQALRQSYCSGTERVLFSSQLAPPVAAEVEKALWKVGFYSFIEEYRARLKQVASKKRDPSVSGHGVEKNRIGASFRAFLEVGMSFYSRLLHRLCAEFRITLPGSSLDHVATRSLNRSFLDLSGNTKNPRISSAHRALQSLGDLARYRNQIDTTLHLNSAFPIEVAVGFYLCAAELYPLDGSPLNQLAVIAAQEKKYLDAVYYYIRAISLPNAFPIVKENLGKLFSVIGSKQASRSLEFEDDDDDGEEEINGSDEDTSPQAMQNGGQPSSAQDQKKINDLLFSFLSFHGSVFHKDLSANDEDALQGLCESLFDVLSSVPSFLDQDGGVLTKMGVVALYSYLMSQGDFKHSAGAFLLEFVKILLHQCRETEDHLLPGVSPALALVLGALCESEQLWVSLPGLHPDNDLWMLLVNYLNALLLFAGKARKKDVLLSEDAYALGSTLFPALSLSCQEANPIMEPLVRAQHMVWCGTWMSGCVKLVSSDGNVVPPFTLVPLQVDRTLRSPPLLSETDASHRDPKMTPPTFQFVLFDASDDLAAPRTPVAADPSLTSVNLQDSGSQPTPMEDEGHNEDGDDDNGVLGEETIFFRPGPSTSQHAPSLDRSSINSQRPRGNHPVALGTDVSPSLSLSWSNDLPHPDEYAHFLDGPDSEHDPPGRPMASEGPQDGSIWGDSHGPHVTRSSALPPPQSSLTFSSNPLDPQNQNSWGSLFQGPSSMDQTSFHNAPVLNLNDWNQNVPQFVWSSNMASDSAPSHNEATPSSSWHENPWN